MTRERPAHQRTLHSALLEFALTALMMFVVVTTTRWLLGTLDTTGGGWWNTPEGRFLVVAPVSGGTVTAVMLSPWGRVTGGHVNPAVTLAMWRYGRTPGRDVAPFIAAQLLGSVLGVALAGLAWGPVIASPAVNHAVVRPASGVPWPAIAAVEAATMFVIVVVAGIGMAGTRSGPLVPWAVGTLITAQIMAFGTTTGGVANPARAFGPALLAGDLSLLPVYMLAPLVGALAATAAVRHAGARGRTTVT
ncbi:MIP/aquaporin family protein [Streptomyces sp. YKOK-I1]